MIQTFKDRGKFCELSQQLSANGNYSQDKLVCKAIIAAKILFL
jgi:hypothetical protein